MTDAEYAALKAVGIETTLALQQATTTPEARAALVAKSGLDATRVAILACQTDLLRVNGVGPSMVKLLQASDVKHLAHLRTAAADALLAAMRTANKAHRVAPVLPQLAVVEDWVAQAKALPQLLSGVK